MKRGRSAKDKKPTFHFPLNSGKPWACRSLFFKDILEVTACSLNRRPGYLYKKKTKQKRDGSQDASIKFQLQFSLELVLPTPRSRAFSSPAGRSTDLWHVLRERARGREGTVHPHGDGIVSTPETTPAAYGSSFVSAHLH